jgi:hypothetical protein
MSKASITRKKVQRILFNTALATILRPPYRNANHAQGDAGALRAAVDDQASGLKALLAIG